MYLDKQNALNMSDSHRPFPKKKSNGKGLHQLLCFVSSAPSTLLRLIGPEIGISDVNVGQWLIH